MTTIDPHASDDEIVRVLVALADSDDPAQPWALDTELRALEGTIWRTQRNWKRFADLCAHCDDRIGDAAGKALLRIGVFNGARRLTPIDLVACRRVRDDAADAVDSVSGPRSARLQE